MRAILLAASLTLTFMAGTAAAQSSQEQEKQELLELRNTVVILLQSLVEQGVLTSEQASEMVARAQADAAAAAASEPELRDDDVRVTYVPQFVRDEIREELREELGPQIVADVKSEARDEGWGVPAALPNWLRRVRISGDIRSRAQGVFFASDNAVGTYLDFNAVNQAGGIDLAGFDALRNTTEDRAFLDGRIRVALTANLSDNVSAGFRVTTGDLNIPVSANQILGGDGQRWDTAVDRAYLRYNSNPDRTLGQTLVFGRMDKPFVGGELIWDNDFGFEGAYYATEWRSSGQENRLKFGIGYFPIREIEFTSDDATLASAELLGTIGVTDDASISLAAAYHVYDNITGIRNAPDSDLTDFTAPTFLQRGNTLFDIRNDLDPATNLFALAAEFEILNISARAAVEFPSGQQLSFTADYVRNLGYDEDDVRARTGLDIDERTEGYEAMFRLGRQPVWERRPEGFEQGWEQGDWSVLAGYRYVQRDAVVDAFTDSNLGRGATDVEGYVVSFEYAFIDDFWLRLRYFSSSEIDGPPLAIDNLQLDLNARF
ncbi:MAG: putative porin [Pseudomonadota bacterium]